MERNGLRAAVEGHTLAVPPTGQADIGRAPACALRVDDERVAPYHVVIWATEHGWVLADRGTPTGTWSGGQRVSQIDVSGALSVRLGDPVDGPLLELTLDTDPSPSRPVEPAAPPPAHLTVRPVRADVPRPSGIFTTAYVPTAHMRFGREHDNDVVVDDLLVSRHHAEVRARPDGTADIIDLGSLNGTFVNGERITRAVIGAHDLVAIGHAQFRLVGGRLEEYHDTGAVTFEASNLTVTGRDGRVLVDDVGFTLNERSLFGIVGPSGSGKSSLLSALSGLRPAPAGRVLYDGRDLYHDYAELRHRIGIVPQEDVLHRELELRRALEYSGRLRFPADVDRRQRQGRIDSVLAELGISHRADSPIHRLSGGERKRTSVALELLTKPSLLFLDEPASGLDPGLARVLMVLLRELADDGRTIVVVTHELASLSLCDQILVLAPGGIPAYVGPPAQAASRFGRDDMADVFGDLVTEGSRDWRFAGRPTHAPVMPAGDSGMPAGGAPAGPGVGPAATSPTVGPDVGQRWVTQLRTLTARYLEVLAADRRNAALLLLQAPVLGVLILAALPAGELGPPTLSEVRLVSAAGMVLFVLLVGATWLGANNAIREIARELPMLKRERASGLSLSAYVVSKVLVLAALTTVQAVVLVALATARQRGPDGAAVLGWAPGELMVIVAASGIAAMALALFVSAVAGSPERATTVLPIVLILQLVLAAGVVLPEIVDKPGLRELSLVSSTQWGIAGAASTADLNRLQVFDQRLRSIRTVDATNPGPAVAALTGDGTPNERWAHTPRAWLTALLALVLLTLVPLVGTTFALRRYDPGR